jgi:hypothetical protein
MKHLKRFASTIWMFPSMVSKCLFVVKERIKPGAEFHKATQFWAKLDSYHLTNDTDPIAIRRSQYISNRIIPLVQP